MKEPTPSPPHADTLPLSALLGRVLEGVDGGLTLQEVADRTGGRGGYLLLILLCLPFTTPVPLPGVSSVFGAVILWVAVASGGEGGLRLPRWLGRKVVGSDRLRGVLRASGRFLGWIEKAVKPRGHDWLGTGMSRRLHALLMVWLAALLMLPLPVPFTNSLPGYSIIVVSACLMERDGRVIFVGYLVSLAASVYVMAALVGGMALIEAAWRWISGVWGFAT
jgi:hypothetical protein